MIGTGPSSFPHTRGGFHETIDSRGFGFLSFQVTESLILIGSALVGVLSCGSHDLASTRAAFAWTVSCSVYLGRRRLHFAGLVWSLSVCVLVTWVAYLMSITVISSRDGWSGGLWGGDGITCVLRRTRHASDSSGACAPCSGVGILGVCYAHRPRRRRNFEAARDCIARLLASPVARLVIWLCLLFARYRRLGSHREGYS